MDLVAKFLVSVQGMQIFATSSLNQLMAIWPEGMAYLLGDSTWQGGGGDGTGLPF